MIVPGRSIITDHDKSHPFIIHQTDSEVEYSRSYPGLKTVYNIHTVKCRVKERPRVFLSACFDGSSMVQWSMWLKNRSATGWWFSSMCFKNCSETDDDSHSSMIIAMCDMSVFWTCENLHHAWIKTGIDPNSTTHYLSMIFEHRAGHPRYIPGTLCGMSQSMYWVQSSYSQQSHFCRWFSLVASIINQNSVFSFFLPCILIRLTPTP